MADPTPRFRALLVGVRSHGFATDRTLRRVKNRLGTMFPDSNERIKAVTDRRESKRDPLRRRIQTWVDDTQEGDICLFYYFGHGGRAKFTDLSTRTASEQVVPYLSCETSSTREFTGLLSRELSTWLSEADRRCGNVTAIIDSCYSGTIVREGQADMLESREAKTLRTFERSPKWVRDELNRGPSELLAAESHPRVVRLSGASPRREAHPHEAAENEGVGMFTVALLEVLRAAGDDWRSLSWEMLAHAVRERVISSHGMEGQWISLAGPSERLLFSRDRLDRSPRAVGYRNTADGHWIRAGLLTGVEEGDRWAVADPFAGPGERHEPLLRTTVKTGKVQINRAELSIDPDQPVPECSLSPAAAVLLRVARPMPVFVDGAVQPSFELDKTVWLRASGPDSRHRVCLDEGKLELRDADGEWARARFDTDDAGRKQLIDLLEDRARSTRLIASLEALAEQRRQRSPITGRIGLGSTAVDPGTSACPGSDLWVRLENTAKGGPHWFSSVVLIDVMGRPWLLNGSQLDGVELEPDDLEYIGRRTGALREGVLLDWPKEAVADKPGRIRVVTISSGRPIQLAHLARALPVSETAAFRMQGLERPPDRDEPEKLDKLPALSRGWGWGSVELALDLPGTKET